MTGLDTNILISLWSSDAALSHRTAQACQQALRAGPVHVCGPVYAELLGLPGRTPLELDARLKAAGVEVNWQFGEEDWRTVGDAYQSYVRRRRNSGGGIPRRMISDFLIGAHAVVRGATLLTLDRSHYSVAFPQLRLGLI